MSQLHTVLEGFRTVREGDGFERGRDSKGEGVREGRGRREDSLGRYLR